MNLEDLLPESPTFELKSTGKTYELRPPDLSDRVKLGKMGDINLMFSEKRWDEVCKVIYLLLKDKSDFIATKEKFIDDDGFEREGYVTGPACLLRAIQSQKELIQVLCAFNSAVAASEPLVKDYIVEELKKNLQAHPIGPKSSTSLPQSTDIPPSNSANLPSGIST
jgi:hypothetical protein